VDALFVLQGIRFTWDVEKAAENLRKHAVSFETAAEVFFDPFLQYARIEQEDEKREAIIGLTVSWELLFVIFLTSRGTFRLISARRATRTERGQYENR
jgi:uncharacterized DUF497 family protein